jgi:alpha-1,3-glucan synthase
MRTDQESDEVSRVYNLGKDTIEKYVQFGEVFNLLHAGVSYLRVHQKGFGAVGVSNKYGARSFARYRKSFHLQSYRNLTLNPLQLSSGA